VGKGKEKRGRLIREEKVNSLRKNRSRERRRNVVNAGGLIFTKKLEISLKMKRREKGGGVVLKT